MSSPAYPHRHHGTVVFLAGVSAATLIVLASIALLMGLFAVPFEVALGLSVAFAAACAAMIRALVDLLPRQDRQCAQCELPRNRGEWEPAALLSKKRASRPNLLGVNLGRFARGPINGNVDTGYCEAAGPGLLFTKCSTLCPVLDCPPEPGRCKRH